MDQLNLDQARQIVSEGFNEAHQHSFQPLAIVVLDAGGHIIVAEREDGASFFRVEIAGGKAWASLAMNTPGRALAARAETTPWFFDALSSSTPGPFAPATGGVLVLDDTTVVGAVGVSGDGANEDEAVAIAGIRAAGLQPDPAEPTPGDIRHRPHLNRS